MSIFSKLRLATAAALLALASSRASAQTVTDTINLGSFSTNWANVGGPGSFYSDSFIYPLFDATQGTLLSVEFCLTIKGQGDWMADYGGDGNIKSMNIDLFGGQYVDIDGGLGWLGAGFNPVVDNYQISSTVSLNNVTVPYWIMSPDDGPAFSWFDYTSFNLPNINEFIGPGSDSANFSTYALLSYLTDPSVNIALEGHDFQWKSELSLKYTYAPIPEPGSALLLGVAGLGIFGRRRRLKK